MQKSVNWFSKKDNIKLVFVAVLSIVLIVVLKAGMSGGKDAESSAASPEIYNTAEGTPAPFIKQTRVDRPLKRKSGKSKTLDASTLKAPPSLKRDIFSFRLSKNSSKREEVRRGPDLELNATITDERQPLAIIGSEVLGIGDVVKGYTLTEIKNHEAVLSRDGEHYTLRMLKE